MMGLADAGGGGGEGTTFALLRKVPLAGRIRPRRLVYCYFTLMLVCFRVTESKKDHSTAKNVVPSILFQLGSTEMTVIICHFAGVLYVSEDPCKCNTMNCIYL